MQEEYDLFFLNREKIILDDLLAGKGNRLSALPLLSKEEAKVMEQINQLHPRLAGCLIAVIFGCPKAISFALGQKNKHFLKGLDTVYWCNGANWDAAADILAESDWIVKKQRDSNPIPSPWRYPIERVENGVVTRFLDGKVCQNFSVPDRRSAERIMKEAICQPQFFDPIEKNFDEDTISFASAKAEEWFSRALWELFAANEE